MILVRAPLRLSFFGGGSDIPSHFLKYGGATLSATFDKFIYVALITTPQSHIKVTYSTTEYATTVDAVKHDIVREALRHYHIPSHIEISSFADIPTLGTGLGASSAFNVALVAGLERLRRTYPSTRELISTAAHIELDQVQSPIGYQDHIAAAQGGMIFARYHADSESQYPFVVESAPLWAELFDCLFLVKMPARRVSANDLLQQGMRPTNVARLAEMAYQGKDCLERKDIAGFGALLHDAWQEKKQAHPDITTDEIDRVYDIARTLGILGGKLLGAGNGGYLLLCAPNRETKERVQATIGPALTWYNVQPITTGVTIVYDDREHN